MNFVVIRALVDLFTNRKGAFQRAVIISQVCDVFDAHRQDYVVRRLLIYRLFVGHTVFVRFVQDNGASYAPKWWATFGVDVKYFWLNEGAEFGTVESSRVAQVRHMDDQAPSLIIRDVGTVFDRYVEDEIIFVEFGHRAVYGRFWSSSRYVGEDVFRFHPF